MPTIDFQGKQFVYSHHLTVPSCPLEIDAAKSLPPERQKTSLDGNPSVCLDAGILPEHERSAKHRCERESGRGATLASTLLAAVLGLAGCEGAEPVTRSERRAEMHERVSIPCMRFCRAKYPGGIHVSDDAVRRMADWMTKQLMQSGGLYGKLWDQELTKAQRKEVYKQGLYSCYGAVEAICRQGGMQ